MFYVSHHTADSPFASPRSIDGFGHRETMYACQRVEYHTGDSVVLWGEEREGLIATLRGGRVFVMNADGKTINRMDFSEPLPLATSSGSVEQGQAKSF